MIILFAIIGGCMAALAFCVFMMEVLPRLRPAYYVVGVAGVKIGPFYRRRSAERYARGRGLAAIDPALDGAGRIEAG
jgi:hypothetical protein